MGVGKTLLRRRVSGAHQRPMHIISDGDRTIESVIDMAYGGRSPHQLCQFHLLREYKRNIGKAGFSEAMAAAWVG